MPCSVIKLPWSCFLNMIPAWASKKDISNWRLVPIPTKAHINCSSIGALYWSYCFEGNKQYPNLLPCAFLKPIYAWAFSLPCQEMYDLVFFLFCFAEVCRQTFALMQLHHLSECFRTRCFYNLQLHLLENALSIEQLVSQPWPEKQQNT